MAKAKGAAAQRRPRSSRSLGGLSGSGSAALASARRRRLAVVHVDCGVEDNYLFSYLSDEQCMGIFVRTLAPLPTGTHLRLRFPGITRLAPPASAVPGKLARLSLLPDDADLDVELEELDVELELERTVELDVELGAALRGLGEAAPSLGSAIALEGEVIWVNAYRPSEKDNLHPGMGVRFVALDAPTRARLMVLVGRFAYI